MPNSFSSDPTHEDSHIIKALARTIVSNFKWSAQNICLVIMSSLLLLFFCVWLSYEIQMIFGRTEIPFFFLLWKAIFKMKLEIEFFSKEHSWYKLLLKQYSRSPPFKFRRAGVIWVSRLYAAYLLEYFGTLFQ